jgi:hypothetical protein
MILVLSTFMRMVYVYADAASFVPVLVYCDHLLSLECASTDQYQIIYVENCTNPF